MKIHKFKNIKIFSNGSANFSYHSCNNLKFYTFLEKDHKTFHLNLKTTNLKLSVEKFSSTYKNKYFINK
jgi:hypothetical protein